MKPGEQITNSDAKPGDVLVLTKAIGTGVITTALKAGEADPAVVQGAVDSMTHLNRGAAEAMQSIGVNAATDISGFGLLGHLKGMAAASGLSARVNLGTVPVLDGVIDLLNRGVAPGGTRRNLESLEGLINWNGVGEIEQLLLSDAQTSGGMLISVARDRLDDLVKQLVSKQSLYAVAVGEMVEGEPGTIAVEP